jgi:hypothetical protein
LFWVNALVCFQLSTERKNGLSLVVLSLVVLSLLIVSLLIVSLVVLSLVVLSLLMVSLLVLVQIQGVTMLALSLLWFDCMFGVMNEKQYAFHAFNFF